MTPEMSAIGGAVLASIFWVVIIGRVNHVSDGRIRRLTRVTLDQRELITHLSEGSDARESRAWEPRDDGVYTVIERGRPDLTPSRQVALPPNQLPLLIDAGDIPDWEGSDA